MEWTEERIELLKRLWTEGLSARQIAEKLGDVTRNAVIGKANRLGLSKPTKSAITRKQKRVESQQRPVAPVPPSAGGATILTLTTSSCRWPLGDPAEPEFRFCGANTPTLEQPYCEFHSRLAYQPPNRDKRKRIA